MTAGLRDLAPLERAIQLGATEIVCVACYPQDVGTLGPDFDRGDPVALVGRVMEIVANELLNGDLEILLETNRLIAEAGGDVPALRGRRCIPLLVVRPAATIAVDITRFGSRDISEMIGQGGDRVRARISEALADPRDPGHDIAADLFPKNSAPARRDAA